MGIKTVLTKVVNKANDAIAKAAALSPGQIQQIQQHREEYLQQLPSMDDEAAEELTRRLLAAESIEIYSEYLEHLQDIYVPIKREAEYDADFNTSYNIRYVKITKWVTDRKENSLEKLINVYEVLSNEDCNIALVFHRTMDGTEVYLAVVNTQNSNDNVNAENYQLRLAEAIRGNFPGSRYSEKPGIGVIPFMRENRPYSVAAASNVPGEKSEKFISQTIEKLFDGIIPDSKTKEYTLILMATPIRDIENRKLHLQELYTGLAPYAAWSTSFTYTESNTAASNATFGVNAGVTAGVQNAANTTTSESRGITDNTGRTTTQSSGSSSSESSGTTDTQTTGSSVTDTTGTSTTNTSGSTTSTGTSNTTSNSTSTTTGTSESSSFSDSENSSVTGGVGFVGQLSTTEGITTSSTTGASSSLSDTVSTGLTTGVSDTVSESASQAVGNTTSQAIGKNVAQAVAKTVSQTVAQNVGKAVSDTLGKAISKTVTTGKGILKGTSLGANFGVNFARSSNVAAIVGKNEGIHQSFTNYTIKHTLEILEEQMKRLEQSTALGMWDFAAYVISEDQNVANNVAHTYLALTQGETSYMSQTAVNLWRGDMGHNSDDAREICAYLRELRHPLFGLNPELVELEPDYNVYPAIVTAATSLSGKELAYSLNFPQKSLSGFPVLECAEFGRNVVKYEQDKTEDFLELGHIFHMNHEETDVVFLGKNSLTSHTFITGSTGSGKSNTVFHLLEEAEEQDISFLVIEPAKGEYKEYFGAKPGVSVYGTNPYTSPMLHLNPFSFPDRIHVFEHLDRLVEIFNVCWPMYAAMPSVLKSAIEKSYADCGWDLMRSVNKYGERIYPVFADVAKNIRSIIDTSEYDTENKGAYKGALLTRLQSLSTGINGTVFTSDEISPEELFDNNAIIDLSRVGSSETKALIMGLLILKQQEYRMATATVMNAGLKHITVLEEAHNILRRTPANQSSDSSNLMGKSVEMLSNAIAEMRTYGEGFVIVDQAPGLLDMAVIRNTNTKIIMRLPDKGDRELVGYAANLNDDQIKELAKLPLGVAAVYQNEWVQPVLCMINRYQGNKKQYVYIPGDDVFSEKNTEILSESILDCIMNKELFRENSREEMDRLKKEIVRSKLGSEVKVDLLEYIYSEEDQALFALRKLVYDFLSAKEAIDAAKQCTEVTTWAKTVVDGLKPSILQFSNRQINLALALIINEQTVRDTTYNDLFCRFTEVYNAEGRVY